MDFGQDGIQTEIGAIARGSLLRGGATALGVLLSIPAAAILVRSLGVGGFGTLALAVTIATQVGLLADLGLTKAVLRAASQDDNRAGSWGKTGARIGLLSGGVGAAFCVAAAALAAPAVPRELLLAAPLALTTVLAAVLSSLLMAKRAVGLVEGSIVSQHGIYYGSAITLGLAQLATVPRVIICLLLSQVSRIVVLFPQWRRAVGRAPSPKMRLARALLRMGLPLLAADLSWIALQRSDVIMLGLFAGRRDVGTYAVVLRVVDLTVVILGVIGTYYLPAASRFIQRGQMLDLRILYVILAKWTVVFTGPLFATLLIAPDPLFRALFGTDFPDTDVIVRVLSIGYLVNVLAGHNGVTLVALGRTRQIAVRSVVSLISNLALNAILIPRLGVLGAAVSTSIAYTGMNIANSALLWKARIHPLRRDFLAVVGTVGIAATVSWALIRALDWEESLTGTILVATLAAAAGFISALRTLTRSERAVFRGWRSSRKSNLG